MVIADRLTLRSVFHTRRFSNGLRFAFPTVYQGWDKADASRARVGKAARCRARYSLSLEAVKKDASRIDELDHQTFAESKLTRKSNRLRNPLKKTNRHPDLR